MRPFGCKIRRRCFYVLASSSNNRLQHEYLIDPLDTAIVNLTWPVFILEDTNINTSSTDIVSAQYIAFFSSKVLLPVSEDLIRLDWSSYFGVPRLRRIFISWRLCSAMPFPNRLQAYHLMLQNKVIAVKQIHCIGFTGSWINKCTLKGLSDLRNTHTVRRRTTRFATIMSVVLHSLLNTQTIVEKQSCIRWMNLEWDSWECTERLVIPS